MTETITRRTITRIKDFFDEGYNYNGDIGTFFYSVIDEEDIEYYT